MLRLYRYRTVIILFFIYFSIASLQDADSQDQAARRPAEIYLEKTGSAREYVDGKDYYSYYSGFRTSPVLRHDEEQSASLMIHGRIYNNLVLKYDTFTDELIYTDDSLIYKKKNRQIALNKYNVRWFDLCFTIDTMHFRYLSNDIDTSFNLKDGYYEIAHDGRTKLIVRHISAEVIHSSPDDASDLREYFYEPVNYIKIGNSFQQVSSRKRFISLFGHRSDEISHFLRQHGIRIKSADKRQITEVLKYYEQLH